MRRIYRFYRGFLYLCTCIWYPLIGKWIQYISYWVIYEVWGHISQLPNIHIYVNFLFHWFLLCPRSITSFIMYSCRFILKLHTVAQFSCWQKKTFYKPQSIFVFILTINVEMEIHFTCTPGLNFTSKSWLSKGKSSDGPPFPAC